MKKGFHLIMLLAVFTATSIQAAGIQKWVDAEGNTHYGDAPPAGKSSEEVQIDAASSSVIGGGLRPDEKRRLYQIEAEERNAKYRRELNTDRDRYQREIQQRDDNLYRCRELDRQFANRHDGRAAIVTQQRRLGCQ